MKIPEHCYYGQRQALEKYAKINYKYLQVKTVDEGHYKEYDQTIAFYKKMGFSKLEVFPDLWDEWNPCLVMVKAIPSISIQCDGISL